MSIAKPTQKQLIVQFGELVAKVAFKDCLSIYNQDKQDDDTLKDKKDYLLSMDEFVLETLTDLENKVDRVAIKAYKRLVALECKKK